jgi:hypothetical protein
MSKYNQTTFMNEKFVIGATRQEAEKQAAQGKRKVMKFWTSLSCCMVLCWFFWAEVISYISKSVN